jgi:hypothetical protein
MSASSTHCDGNALTGLSTRSVLLRHFNTTTLALSLFVAWALVSAGGKGVETGMPDHQVMQRVQGQPVSPGLSGIKSRQTGIDRD